VQVGRVGASAPPFVHLTSELISLCT
jgi:hypothetical protein